MSLFDSASLIITPNGVKEDKLYAIKPTDGSGDLVVTRATTATRVNSDGLIEVTPYNLLQRSEEFNNAYWTKTTATISANATTAPNGTLTADKLIGNNLSTASNVNVAITVSQGVNYNFSVYAKASGADWIQLIATGTTIASPARLWVNVSTGALGTNNGGFFNVNVSDEGNGWYRISGYFTTTSTTTTLYYAPATADNINGYAGNGTDGLFLWGAQLVIGTSAKEYFPTTDRLDVPRLDYTNSSCPSILVEPQRTNLILRSEEFDNASWAKTRCSITSNSIISPNGTLTADTLVEDNTANATHPTSQSVTVTASPQTFSIYAKSANRNWLQLQFLSTSNASAFFDLSNGVVGTVGSAATASITSVGNGWYRCIITTTTAAGSNTVGIYPASANGTNSFTGNGTASLYIWGAQLEAGSNATSYIPTVASSVTRNADVISKTGISSLIGQTEGTLFLDVKYSVSATASGQWFKLFGVSNVIALASNGSNFIRIIINGISDNITTAPKADLGVKIALAYNSSGVVLFVNGIQYALTNGGSQVISSLNSISLDPTLNSSLQTANINSAILWKERLSNTELAQLTTI